MVKPEHEYMIYTLSGELKTLAQMTDDELRGLAQAANSVRFGRVVR